ncbi:MAG TPA: 50S ribosomal protein L22 [Candidatus Norongarragalinales archaeon]|jgi:ribosomal protein uL22|nr:50S ribosomal protein L22 [Candidatus Norongarragalinales archaeon]
MTNSIYNYGFQPADAAKVGRAQGYDYNASYKDLSQCCATIKYKPVTRARQILDDVISMKMPIWYTNFNSRLGARSQLGGKRGRYPKKEAKILHKLLQNAVANATAKGLDPAKLVVQHASAYKQNTYPRSKRVWVSSVVLGYGKMATRHDFETARCEITVAENEAAVKKFTATKADRKKDKAKTQAKPTHAKPATHPTPTHPTPAHAQPAHAAATHPQTQHSQPQHAAKQHAEEKK